MCWERPILVVTRDFPQILSEFVIEKFSFHYLRWLESSTQWLNERCIIEDSICGEWCGGVGEKIWRKLIARWTSQQSQRSFRSSTGFNLMFPPAINQWNEKRFTTTVWFKRWNIRRREKSKLLGLRWNSQSRWTNLDFLHRRLVNIAGKFFQIYFISATKRSISWRTKESSELCRSSTYVWFILIVLNFMFIIFVIHFQNAMLWCHILFQSKFLDCICQSRFGKRWLTWYLSISTLNEEDLIPLMQTSVARELGFHSARSVQKISDVALECDVQISTFRYFLLSWHRHPLQLFILRQRFNLNHQMRMKYYHKNQVKDDSEISVFV